MERKIYIVTQYSYEYKNTELFGTGYDNKEKAIEFIESKLTQQDILKNKRIKEEGLMTCDEFITDEYCYNIKEINLI